MVRPTPNTNNSSRKRVLRAANDPRILLVPLYMVERKYNLGHAAAREAREIAERQARLSGRINEVDALRDRDRRIGTLRNAERSYPGIVRALVTAKNLSAVGRYFTISHGRVCQLNKTLSELAVLLGCRRSDIFTEYVDRGLWPKTAVESFDGGE